MTSAEQIGDQLLGMEKVRIQFHLNDGSVHEGWVVGFAMKSDSPRIAMEVEDLQRKAEPGCEHDDVEVQSNYRGEVYECRKCGRERFDY